MLKPTSKLLQPFITSTLPRRSSQRIPSSKPVPRRPPPTPPTPTPTSKKLSDHRNHPSPSTPSSQQRKEESKGEDVKSRSVWQSWKVLPYNTKLIFCLAASFFSIGGLILADKLEEWYPPPSSQKKRVYTTKLLEGSTDQSEADLAVGLARHVAADDEAHRPQQAGHKPKLFRISMVDREDRNKET